MRENDINFLYEIGTLRFIQRTWTQFIGTNFANLAEHTLRVIWIALVIAKNEDNADIAKVIKMALVHDVTESRTGDANYLTSHYTQRNEELAVHDIFHDTSLKEFEQLWNEYENLLSVEARIVKDADNIDVNLELMEQRSRGNVLADKWYDMREVGIGDKLHTNTAKKIWKSINSSDPDQWHLQAPNRFNR